MWRGAAVALGYGRTGVARRRRLPCPTFTIVNPLALRHSVRGTPRAGGGGPFRRAAARTAAGDGAGTRPGRCPPAHAARPSRGPFLGGRFPAGVPLRGALGRLAGGDAGPAAVLGTQVEEAAEGAPDDEARGDDDHLADRDAHGDEYD